MFFFVAYFPELAADPNKKNAVLTLLGYNKCTDFYTSSMIPRERAM